MMIGSAKLKINFSVSHFQEILNAKAFSLGQQGKGKRPNKAQTQTSDRGIGAVGERSGGGLQ